MARKLRFIPHSRTLIAITCRTVQGRFLLRPGHQINDIILGILGRATSATSRLSVVSMGAPPERPRSRFRLAWAVSSERSLAIKSLSASLDFLEKTKAR